MFYTKEQIKDRVKQAIRVIWLAVASYIALC